MFDGKAYGEGIVEIVKGYVEREIAPLKAENESLKARIKELEEKPDPEAPEMPTLKSVWESVRPEAEEIIRSAVAAAVAEVPKAKDGKDAANIKEALKHEGELVLTLEDGRLIKTGIRDGKDGEPGKEGRDGFSLEDFDVEPIDERSIDLRFRKGDVTHSFELKFPVPVYRGVFKQGESYVRGDLVTWGGSLHHCNEDTSEKPDTGPWTIAAKKGRDGKDAKHG